jgi:hypothetical protein
MVWRGAIVSRGRASFPIFVIRRGILSHSFRMRCQGFQGFLKHE